MTYILLTIIVIQSLILMMLTKFILKNFTLVIEGIKEEEKLDEKQANDEGGVESD